MFAVAYLSVTYTGPYYLSRLRETIPSQIPRNPLGGKVIAGQELVS